MWHVTALVAFPYSIKGLRDTVACDQMTTGGNHLGRERGLDKQCAPEAREEGKEEDIRTVIRSQRHREREEEKWHLGQNRTQNGSGAALRALMINLLWAQPPGQLQSLFPVLRNMQEP